MRGADVLLEHAAMATTRPQAFAALIVVEMLGLLHDLVCVEKHHSLVVVYQSNGHANIVLPYDYMSWTQSNLHKIWTMTRSLRAVDVSSKDIDFVLAGDLSDQS
ncbi:hypothetical protein [Pseudovibrio sp. Ad37]|uniref:hypothetical protein n=1 Tax=Pseudovibrio sp. Ad37 TaxID=989422 RepID=UPI0007AE7591|nr:hypothetical protein [Pseudovibrio sp. Ad37]